MFSPEIEQILTALLARPRVVMAASLAGQCAEYVREKNIAVVCDARTHAALGARVAEELRATLVLLPGDPMPDEATVAHIVAQSAQCDMLVAVGSGTINDLCQYAAHHAGKPYGVFPTAPSMNGYTSANASILIGGKKESLPARLPVLVACDMGVIAGAPIRLIRAGLGDALARSTAQADWLLSHLAKGTFYDERPFALTAPYEPPLLAAAAQLAQKDPAAVELLMKTLLLSGFGMTLAGGSYPASQGEHMIAHAYHRLAGENVRTFHGEEIGVTTLTMARLQEEKLSALPPAWAQRIRAVMLPASFLESVLRAAGSAIAPQDLGWDEALYRQAIRLAPQMRDRFTFLSVG